MCESGREMPGGPGLILRAAEFDMNNPKRKRGRSERNSLKSNQRACERRWAIGGAPKFASCWLSNFRCYASGICNTAMGARVFWSANRGDSCQLVGGSTCGRDEAVFIF